MRILTSILVLIVGINQLLARSVPLHRNNYKKGSMFNDYEYDLFGMPFNNFDDDIHDFHTFLMEDNSEEANEPLISSSNQKSDVGHLDSMEKSKEKDISSLNDNDDVGNLVEFFDDFLSTFLEISEGDADNVIKPQSNNNENERKSDNNSKTNDDKREKENNGDNNESSNSEETIISFMKDDKSDENNEEPTSNFEVDIFDLARSSEENKVDEGNNAKSLNEFVFKKDKKDDENSNEVTPNEDVEIIAMEKSSEEKMNDNDVAISESDINELFSFFLTFTILDDMFTIAGNNPEFKDDDMRSKEVDEILTVVDSILDKMIENELHSKENKNDNDNQDESNEDDKIINTSADKNYSDEDDHNFDGITTTPKYDSNENDEDNDDKNKNSNIENEENLISFVFHGIDNIDEKKNLNDHEYSVINTWQPFTSAPYIPKSTSTLAPVAQKVISEYAELREKLDKQQNFLQKNELAIDKDLYEIISNNYDDDSMNKFEKDMYVVHENLDRIKRNINAMQNLQSKLYFHKLVTAAVNEVQNNPVH